MNWPSSLKSLSCDAGHSARNFRNRWDRAFGPNEADGGIVPQPGPFADDPATGQPMIRCWCSNCGAENKLHPMSDTHTPCAICGSKRQKSAVPFNLCPECGGISHKYDGTACTGVTREQAAKWRNPLPEYDKLAREPYEPKYCFGSEVPPPDPAIATAVIAERKRCAGVARNAIREADKMLGRADVEWFRSSLKLVLDGMDPTEGKYSLSREQEQKDAIAEALMLERDRCAKIADDYLSKTGRSCAAAAISELIRGRK